MLGVVCTYLASDSFLFSDYLYYFVPVKGRTEVMVANYFHEASYHIGVFAINITVDLEEHLFPDLGDHKSLVEKLTLYSRLDVRKDLRHVIRVQPNTTMSVKMIDARWGDRAVNSITRDTEPKPIGSQGIIGAGRHTRHHGLSFSAHLLLNRFRDLPLRVFALVHDRKTSGRRRPVGAPERNGKSPDGMRLVEEEEHPLRNVDDDALVYESGNDMAIVDLQLLAFFEEGGC